MKTEHQYRPEQRSFDDRFLFHMSSRTNDDSFIFFQLKIYHHQRRRIADDDRGPPKNLDERRRLFHDFFLERKRVKKSFTC
uniref:Uncharacterized protein n=1 Tax=Romanomermis culicivorax TaxID=13658 RepID=A0A915IT86_ROMCU